MKRVLVLGLLGFVLGLWWFSLPVPQPAPNIDHHTPDVAAAAPITPALRDEAPRPPSELRMSVQGLGDSCGLSANTACEGDSCVVFLEGPNLDQVWGWLELGWSSPRFVGSVLVRDLGVSSVPCAHAINALGVESVRMVPTADGREIWCGGTGPDHRSLCEQATGVVGFTGETRVLRF